MVPLCVGILSFALTQNNQPAMEHIYGWLMCFVVFLSAHTHVG